VRCRRGSSSGSDRMPMDADFSGSERVRPGQELPLPELEAWLAANVDGFKGALTIEQFKGGQSNPTYKLTTASRSYVLRCKPRGPVLKGAHAVEREYRVTRELSRTGFPVATPLALCTDDGVIGSVFFVMELVVGRLFWGASLPGLSSEERGRYFDALNATLATLHTLKPHELALDGYGRSDRYLERQIARWSSQYRADEAAGRNSDMDRLTEWLPRHMPEEGECRLVHGDFRADNVIFDPKEPRVLAVLDWELSTVGNPIADFTYHLMMYRLPESVLGSFAQAELATLGIPTEEAYVEAYCRRTGRDRIENLNFFMAFNMFRFAAILHGIRGRIARGTATSAHAKFMADQVDLLASLAWSHATDC
jgi:aminoglycoside phosphotransferase (APT) family kinase protein